jgi:hypothetical protein
MASVVHVVIAFIVSTIIAAIVNIHVDIAVAHDNIRSSTFPSIVLL